MLKKTASDCSNTLCVRIVLRGVRGMTLELFGEMSVFSNEAGSLEL